MTNPIIAAIGDLHFGNKGHSIEIFEQQMRFIEEQFFPFLLKHKIKNVVQLGDTFHDRNKIDWYIQNELKRRYFKWFGENDIQYYSIVGNHDMYHKNTLTQNSLTETTRFFKNIHVYTKPTKITIENYILGFNPWIVDNKNPKLTEKVDILLGHFDIVGMPMLKGITSKEGLNHSQFENYKLVLSGHYHIRTKNDNVHMIGTPFQLSWNDFNEPKGFLVLDDKFNYEYIQNNVNPQYVKIFYDEGILTQEGLTTDKNISVEESLEIVKTNYCRLYTKNIDDQMKLELYHSSLLSVSCDNYKIDIINLNDVVENFDSNSFDESFEDDETTIQLILSCIEGMTFNQDIDKDFLIELAKSEYKEASQEVLSIGDK